MSKRLRFRDISDFKFYKQQLANLTDPSNLPTVCTRYEFVKAVKRVSEEYYDRLYQAYISMPELQFYWNMVNELNRNNEDFQRLALVLQATEDELNEIFRGVALDRLEKPWLED